jgi:F-type H+-transporting ATPase subunit c
MKNVFFFLAAITSVLAANVVYAQTGDVVASAGTGSALAWAAGIIMAFAPAMGTLSQSRAAAAALEGISRNPQAADKIGQPLILSLALMESLVILGFAMAYLLQKKIPG